MRIAEDTGRKKSPFWHHRTTSSGYIFGTEACIDNRKKNLLNSNTSSTRPDNMVNFGLLTAEICWRVWGTPANFNGFRVFASWQRYARHSSSGCQPNFATLNRVLHLYSAGRPSRWALAHILVVYCIISNNRLHLTGSVFWLFLHLLIMVALCNRADHYIFALWFLSSFFFFLSSPNLSRRELDVYHTSTHGVVLVRI